MKWVVSVVIKSAAGLHYIPIQVCENVEVAEAVLKGFRKRNPKVSFSLVGSED